MIEPKETKERGSFEITQIHMYKRTLRTHVSLHVHCEEQCGCQENSRS